MQSSQTPRHTVKRAASLAGITPNQLRLWQKRFRFVNPKRASNGYRLYSDSDVDLLCYIAGQVKHGISLRAMSDMGQQALKQAASNWKEEKKRDLDKDFEKNLDKAITPQETWVQSLIQVDGLEFQRYLALRYTGLSFKEALHQVYLPLVRKIGSLYEEGVLDVVGEHLGVNIIKMQIISSLHPLGCQGGANPVILACAPNDFHDLGLYAGAAELALEQIPYLNLGVATPFPELLKAIQKVNARGVVLTITAPIQDSSLIELLFHIKNQTDTPIALAGKQTHVHTKKLEALGFRVLQKMEELIPWATQLQSD